MDSQCGIEMETMESVLEEAEQQPASSSSAEKDLVPRPCKIADDHVTVWPSTHADLLKSSTVTDINESTMDKNAGPILQNADPGVTRSTDATVEKNTSAVMSKNVVDVIDKASDENSTEIADDKHLDIACGMPAIAAVSGTDDASDKITYAECEAGNNVSSGMSMDSRVDGHSDAAHSASFGAIIDSVSSNIDSIMHSSTNGKESCIQRVSEWKTKEGGTKPMHVVGAEVIDGAEILKASSDASSNAKNDGANAEIITKSEESGELHEVENAFPPDQKNSGDSTQPSKSKDSDGLYDSEVEIIDCTSESLEDQPATGSAGISDSSPNVDGSFVDSNTDIAANPSGSGIVSGRARNSRGKKQALYQKRCTNLRLFRMKLKSGEIAKPPKGKSRVSPHSLDKLTKNNMKFMENFDPKMSNRERRKMQRKTSTRRQLRGDIYGLNGALLSSGKNLCDCMNPNCPGCHFPCPRCQSPKCGHECRVNRKWTYEEIEIDGTDIVIRPQELIESFSNNS